MPRAPSRVVPSFGTRPWPVLLLLSMALPRVRIDLPTRKKGSKDALDVEGTGKPARLVDWQEREITIFHNRRLLPRICIVFPTARADSEEEVDIDILNDEALYQKMMSGDGPLNGGELMEGQDRAPSGAGTELSLEAAIKKAMAEGLDEFEGEAGFEGPGGRGSNDDEEIVPQGSKVLIEGSKGSDTRAVALNFCYGLLQNGLTVTYVSTALGVKEVIEEMHSQGYKIAPYLTDRKFLCIPVYPLIEGNAEKGGLLDKLMASPQLRKTDALVVNAISDFLEADVVEDVSEQIGWYLQGLEEMGKTSFMVFDDDHTGLEALREASDVHILLPSEDGKTVKITRHKAPKANAPALLFRIDAGTGLRSRPRAVEREPDQDR